MNDQMRVRISDGVADLQKQIEPLRERRLRAFAPGQQILAIDELHRHPWPAFLGDASVVQPCNARMLESGENLSLGFETFERRIRARQHELQRDTLIEIALRALGQPHLAHATRPESLPERVGTDHAARRSKRHIVVDRLRGSQRRSIEESIRTCRCRQHREQPCLLRRIGAGSTHEGLAILWREIERGVEQCLDIRLVRHVTPRRSLHTRVPSPSPSRAGRFDR